MLPERKAQAQQLKNARYELIHGHKRINMITLFEQCLMRQKKNLDFKTSKFAKTDTGTIAAIGKQFSVKNVETN